jgi:hypothetical protein
MQKAIMILLAFISLCGYFYACSEAPAEEDTNYLGEFAPSASLGKADDIGGAAAVPVSADSSDTAVWEVYNDWQDTNTEEARKAGLAWEQDSGLNWDQKYHLWVKSLPGVTSKKNAYGFDFTTFSITNPQGKTLQAPVLDCAEVAMFLRVTFAAWHNLPFFMEAQDSKGTRVFMGHFGWRTAKGRYANSPRFKSSYQDFSQGDYGPSNWPLDQKLREKSLFGGDDVQLFISEAAHVGLYFDELYLNKRVGHFLVLLLGSFNSKNLSDAANTFNLKPEAIKEGDFMLERWVRDGVGHTMVVKNVDPGSVGKLRVEHVAGSMPRRQPLWKDETATIIYFTSDETGGSGYSSSGEQYAKLGGGLKRWRVAKKVGEYYANQILPADITNWISSTDYIAIGNRPAQFIEILEVSDLDYYIAALNGFIDDKRNHLRNYPASCSARIWREKAFKLLYKTLYENRGLSQKEVDQQYRRFEDYVFAELDYTGSKTCCWNSSNNMMYEIIMAYSHEEYLTNFVCKSPTVFKNDFGYDIYKDFAASLGLADHWVEWSEDEVCQQKSVSQDQEALHEWTDFCTIKDYLNISPKYCCYLGDEDGDLSLDLGQITRGDLLEFGMAQNCSSQDVDAYSTILKFDKENDPETMRITAEVIAFDSQAEYSVALFYLTEISCDAITCGDGQAFDYYFGCLNSNNQEPQEPIPAEINITGCVNYNRIGWIEAVVKPLNYAAVCSDYKIQIGVE